MKALRTMALAALALLAGAWLCSATPDKSRRRATPITSAATTTQAINELKDDTARINAARRERSAHYHREDGAIVYIDTITGDEWIDSTSIIAVPKMKYPLLCDASAGVNIWDPVMRAFGQKYGLIGFTADVSLHNRYFPSLEIGLGHANSTPDGMDFTYKSPMSVYFKIGADYNFLYNSNPDYKWFAGLRYGFSPFSWTVTNVTPDANYWGEVPPFSLPSVHSTAGWIEFGLGLRVKLWGPISAGWMVRFHSLIHQSKSQYGQPWYIPGFGQRGPVITGSFTITYTLPIDRLRRRHEAAVPEAPDVPEVPEAEAPISN